MPKFSHIYFKLFVLIVVLLMTSVSYCLFLLSIFMLQGLKPVTGVSLKITARQSSNLIFLLHLLSASFL